MEGIGVFHLAQQAAWNAIGLDKKGLRVTSYTILYYFLHHHIPKYPSSKRFEIYWNFWKFFKRISKSILWKFLNRFRHSLKKISTSVQGFFKNFNRFQILLKVWKIFQKISKFVKEFFSSKDFKIRWEKKWGYKIF